METAPVGPDRCILVYSCISALDDLGGLVKTMVREQPAMGPAIQVSTATVTTTAMKNRAETEETQEAPAP